MRTSRIAIAALVASSGASLGSATPNETIVVSVNKSGGLGNLASVAPSISNTSNPSSTYMAFTSSATNLVLGDVNARDDMFVREADYPTILPPGTIGMHSLSSGGAQGNGHASAGVVSGDGRFLAFVSQASNMTPGDTNGQADVFLRTISTGAMAMVSVNSAGGPSNGASGAPAISADGRFVAFESAATNLVAGDTNGQTDVFVRDMVLGVTVRASVASGGAQASGGSSLRPRISADGKVVSFDSAATNLVAGDTNAVRDVFVRNPTANATARISVSSTGAQLAGQSVGPAPLSDTGALICFVSSASTVVPLDTNLSDDLFFKTVSSAGSVKRLTVDPVTLVQANAGSSSPYMTPDGRFVVFVSSASNLVANDFNGKDDIFRYDLLLDLIARESLSTLGVEANGHCAAPAMSYDTSNTNRNYIIFVSNANNLDPVDTNTQSDVYLREFHCISDLTNDGTVDLNDFFEFLNCFDLSLPCADIDGDGAVTLLDFFAFLNAWAVGC